VSALVRTVHGGGADPLDRVELVLEPGGAVHGRVAGAGLDPATATVRLVPVGVDHAVRLATLDAQGGFAIDGVPPGRWRAEAEAPGWFQDGEPEVDVAGAPEEIELLLERTGIVSGVVVDGNGAPVAGATVVLRAQGPRNVEPPRSDAAPARLRWIHPLAGQRLMPWRDFGRFGAPREGPRPAECGRGHCGIDLGGKRGAIVHAAADGVVALVFTEIRKEAGRYVAIDHPGGLRSYYMHLDDIRADLETGQAIRGGDPIGTVGRTGVVKDAPHLHFSIAQERGERTWYIDPEPILQHAVVLPVARALDAASIGPFIAGTTSEPREIGPTPAAPTRLATDAYGRFRLEGVAPGEHVAVAFHAELAPGASDRFTVRAGEETSGVRIELTPGVIVHGRVLGLRGAIAGARIVAEEGSGETSHKVATTFTDARGDYTLRALAGKVSLTVSAAGYGDVTRAVALDRAGRKGDRHREDFDLVLEDARLTGEVLDPEGHAAPAVDVRIVDGPSRRRRTVTDARGQFTIEGVAAGSYVVELASPAHPRMRADLRTGRHAELRLEQGGAISLELRDAHTAAALAGIHVDADGPGDRTARAVTDGRGLASFTGLSPGAWTLRVRADGYIAAEKRVEVAAARVPREVRVELSRGATLAGVVRDRYGRRVSGATVSAGGVSTRTDIDGNFRLVDVPVGAVEVVAEHGDGAARGAISLELAPGDEHLTLKLDVLE
jgi:murein DD-endopeptidase MepM/ murein hydrolase activator NlpD